MKRKNGIFQTVKRTALITGAIFLLFGVQTKSVMAENVVINETNFPDPEFREYVSDNIDTKPKDGVLSNEAVGVTELDVGSRRIANLKGIEYFTALKKLECDRNKLSSLDLSNNKDLEYLHCSENQLISLSVSGNTVLKELNCDSNKLSSLDLSNNKDLEYLRCGFNQLDKLEVGANTALTTLYCNENQLSTLDVGANKDLSVLYCRDNILNSLEVNTNTALTKLDCNNNHLSSLNVSANTALTDLYCDGNQLSSLDVSANTALEDLVCGGNQLSTLDVSKNTALVKLTCCDNQLEILDVSKNTNLSFFYCENNYFSSVDITGLNKLILFDGTREGNILKVTAKEKPAGQKQENEEPAKTTSKSYTAGEQISAKTLKDQKGNEAIPENSSFTITAVSTDGKTSGTVAFNGVEDENAAVVTIPKTIYIDGVSYDVATVSPKAFEKTSDNAAYKVTDNRVGSLTVGYVGQINAKKTKKTVSIPEYSNYRGIRFKVTSLAAKSFQKNTKVTKVKIASSVTLIGNNCFEGCTKLQQIIIGKGLTTIGKNAFKNCRKLTLMQIKGTKLKKVGKAALKGVNAKCKIKVPKKQIKAYTKLFKGKGQKKSVKVMKG